MTFWQKLGINLKYYGVNIPVRVVTFPFELMAVVLAFVIGPKIGK